MVEHQLPQLAFAGSIPVSRSIKETQFVYHDILRFFCALWAFFAVFRAF